MHDFFIIKIQCDYLGGSEGNGNLNFTFFINFQFHSLKLRVDMKNLRKFDRMMKNR